MSSANPTRHLFRLGDVVHCHFWVQKDSQDRRYTGEIVDLPKNESGEVWKLIIRFQTPDSVVHHKTVVLSQIINWRMHYSAGSRS